MRSFFLTVIVLFILVFKLANNQSFESKRSWFDAARHCKSKRLIMESNETVIRDHMQGNNENIWIGRYEAVSDWTFIKGCFNEVQKRITPIISTPLNASSDEDKYLCQGQCTDYKYFGIKDGLCICLEDTPTSNTCKCNEDGCVTILEHNFTENYSRTSNNDDYNCIVATQCVNNEVNRTIAACSLNHLAICDNGRTTNYSTVNSELFCYNHGSFIKRYSNKDCVNLTRPHWTSGRRFYYNNSIVENDSIKEQKLRYCYSTNIENNTRRSSMNCVQKSPQFRFLCKKVTDFKQPIKDDEDQTGYGAVGVAVGSVVAVIAVIVLIAVVIFLHRRLKKNNNAPSKADNAKTVSNLGYNFHVTQSSNIKNYKTDYDYPKVTGIDNDKNFTVDNSRAKPITDEKGGDYSFAQPTDSDSGYAYHSGYDHFNSPVKQSNDSDHYTSAGQAKKIYDDKTGTYDHLSSFERKTNDEESCFNSNYDHLPNITGNDPTYDVSGDVIHDDSDKYDHLPPNFKNDSSSDYQFTRLFPKSAKDESYDHFELKK